MKDEDSKPDKCLKSLKEVAEGWVEPWREAALSLKVIQ